MLAIMGLSLWQPWASLMALGAKRIETRSWSTNYTGLVAIHAAKTWNKELETTCWTDPFRDALFGDDKYVKSEDLPRGCFVGVGKLHRVLSTTMHSLAIPAKDTDEYWFGDYSPNRFMWIFDGIWKLKEPIYRAGHQGLWNIDPDIAELLVDLLPDQAQEQIVSEAA